MPTLLKELTATSHYHTLKNLESTHKSLDTFTCRQVYAHVHPSTPPYKTKHTYTRVQICTHTHTQAHTQTIYIQVWQQRAVAAEKRAMDVEAEAKSVLMQAEFLEEELAISQEEEDLQITTAIIVC